MKRKAAYILILFLLLQVIKVVMISYYSNKFGSSRMEVLIDSKHMIEVKKINENEVSKELNPILMSGEKGIYINNNIKAAAIGTQQGLDKIEKMIFLDGSFLTEEAVEGGRSNVVISEKLANDLFGSSQASGNVINIEGKPYLIVGVYKNKNALIDIMINDGQERIYVPITSSLAKEWPVKALSINGEEVKKYPLEDELLKLGIDKYQDTISDQFHWKQKMVTLSLLPVFAFEVWLFFSIISLIEPFVKTRQKKIGILAGILLGCILVVAVYIVKSGIYVDAHNLPSENIFDISFYWKALKKEWIRHNVFLGDMFSNFDEATYHLKRLVHINNIIQIYLLVLMAVRIKKIKREFIRVEEN